MTDDKKRLPDWFKQDIPDMRTIRELKQRFRATRINTVCQEAHCPNLGHCWSHQIATFMILGNTCTRNCRFCAVRHGVPKPRLSDEPLNVAAIVKELSLRYVVITSVTRDDLKDQGAAQFAATIRAIRELAPETKVEVLIPDLSHEKDNLQQVIEACPDVVGHNMETVHRIFEQVRPQADYQRSLSVLRNTKKVSPSMIVKSGFMVGLGESRVEIKDLLKDLLHAGCDLLTIGQYLAPSRQAHVREERFVSLEEFTAYKEMAEDLGFSHVRSGPKVRSSFLAEEGYRHMQARQRIFEQEKSLNATR